jgi:hypothetical protein
MRVLQVVLLAGVPLVGLATPPLLQRLQADEPAVDGEQPRISGADGVLSAALAGLDAEVAMEPARCTESVRTESRQTRFTAGVRRSDNPAHAAASAELDQDAALLAELEAEVSASSAELAALSARHAELKATVDGLAAREAALEADWLRASADTQEARAQVSEAAEAAAELARRAAYRDSLLAEIADLQTRLPGLKAAAEAARIAAADADPEAARREAALSAGLVESAQRASKTARQQLRTARREGGDVEAAGIAMEEAQARLAQAEERLSLALAAAVQAEQRQDRAAETDREVLLASTALRSAQDALSGAPGHCSILAAKAEKLPRLERRLGHREAEEHGARVELERAASLRRHQVEQLEVAADALRAQREALAALDAGIAAQAAQVAQSRAAVDALPARLSHTRYQDLAYDIEHWTRTCEVAAVVQWRDAAGVLRSERLSGRAEVSDTAGQGYPEAGIEADLREYPASDGALIREAELRLAGDIRDRLAGGALAGGLEADTGR